MSKDLDTSKYSFTLDYPTVKEATFQFPDKRYTLPAVEHTKYDSLTSLCAVVVELHNRVLVLEAKLKGQDYA